MEDSSNIAVGQSATRIRLAAMDELGRTAEEEGRLLEAKKYIKEAAGGFDDQFDPEDMDCVIVLRNWARISAWLGDFATTTHVILRL